MPPIRTALANIRWGVTIGAFFGGIYCAIAIAFAALGSQPRDMNDAPVQLPYLLVLYVSVGLIVGAVVGLLRPLARWRAGAISIGVLCAFVIGFCFVVAMSGLPIGWARNDWITLWIFTAVFGVAGGNSFWKEPLP